jgi:hypothetical protein
VLDDDEEKARCFFADDISNDIGDVDDEHCC